ncbi:MAG TPA: hypothetical protein VGJ98_08780 [Candidatus Eisenbacteria bacterium]|jgi:hypothetical protein
MRAGLQGSAALAALLTLLVSPPTRGAVIRGVVTDSSGTALSAASIFVEGRLVLV